MVLALILLVGCDTVVTSWGTARPPEGDGEIGDGDEDPIDDQLTLREWVEGQEFLLAPWAHRVEGEKEAALEINDDRLRFPSEYEDVRDWRRNDIVWVQSPTMGRNLLRRVTSVVSEGDQIAVFTIPAKLDELFLQARIEGSASLPPVEENARLNTRLCRPYPEDAVARCSTFSELDNDGYFLNPPPGRFHAIVYQHRVEAGMKAEVNEISALLDVTLDYERRERCACTARYYPNIDRIFNRCELGVEPGRAHQEVDNIKGSCRGEVKKFDLSFDGDFDVLVDSLRWDSEPDQSFNFNGNFAPQVLRSVVLPVEDGFFEIEFSLRTHLDAMVLESALTTFDPFPRGPALRAKTYVESTWPRSTNDRRLNVSGSVDFDEDLSVWPSEPEIGGTRDSNVALTVDIRATTRLWGVPGPTIVPLGVKTRSILSDRFEREDFTQSCPVRIEGGGRGALAYADGMPFQTEAILENLYPIFDSCGGDSPSGNCQVSEIDPCEGM